MSGEHGFTDLGTIAGIPIVADAAMTTAGVVRVRPVVPDRLRCACTDDECQRAATAEDLLCDYCRDFC